MSDDDIELIHSPLTRTHSADGHTLQIQIYRSTGSPWILEVVDELGTSTVWDDPFDTDTAALEAAFLAIEEEGIHSFVTTTQREAKEPNPPACWPRPSEAPMSGTAPWMAPLSEEELDELEDDLLDLDAVDGMTLDMLDGFLHALAIGPETVMPSQWLPKVWGRDDGGLLPPVDELEEANHLLGLVMRHFNGIVWGFEQNPVVLRPMWTTTRFDVGEFEDAEMWACGCPRRSNSSGRLGTLFEATRDGQRCRPIRQLARGCLARRRSADAHA